MGHKDMLGQALDPAEFAREAKGTALEQIMKWYAAQVEWRRGLISRYQEEVNILLEQAREAQEQAAKETGPNPLPTHAPQLDPNYPDPDPDIDED